MAWFRNGLCPSKLKIFSSIAGVGRGRSKQGFQRDTRHAAGYEASLEGKHAEFLSYRKKWRGRGLFRQPGVTTSKPEVSRFAVLTVLAGEDEMKQ